MADIDKLVATLSADASPVRAAPHPYKLWALGVGAGTAYLAFALAFSGLRPDIMAKLHEPWFVIELIALALIFVTASLSTALLAYPDLHQMRRTAYAPAYALGLFVLVILLSWHAASPLIPLPEHSYQCTLDISLTALLPAVWTLYVLRKLASTHYRLAGSIALLSAFSIGALWLRLDEQNDSITHLMQWHYLPMLACGLLGLWLGKLILKW